jgi:hypothetical protein
MATPEPQTAPVRGPRRKRVAKAAQVAAKATPKATTVRLQPGLIAGLSLLQRVLKKPMNRMVNEAVRHYVEQQTSEIESDMQQLLERVQAYRRSDPNYKKLWAEFVDAEARYGRSDPAEGLIKGSSRTKARGKVAGSGKTVESTKGGAVGPAQARIREILTR